MNFNFYGLWALALTLALLPPNSATLFIELNLHNKLNYKDFISCCRYLPGPVCFFVF